MKALNCTLDTCIAEPAGDASCLAVATAALFAESRVGKARAKRPEGDSRSPSNRRHTYSVLAGMAAIPQVSPLMADPADTVVMQQ